MRMKSSRHQKQRGYFSLPVASRVSRRRNASASEKYAALELKSIRVLHIIEGNG